MRKGNVSRAAAATTATPQEFVTVSITLPKDLLTFVDDEAEELARKTRRPSNRSGLISDWIWEKAKKAGLASAFAPPKLDSAA
jgi:hypothetical protein